MANISPKEAPVREIIVKTDITPTSRKAVSPTPPNISDVAPGGVGEGTPMGTPSPTLPDPRIAELERKEKAIAAQRRELQQERDALLLAKATPKAPEGTMTAEQWKAKFLEDPSVVGMSYQEMADRYLNQPTEESSKISKLEKEIAALRADRQADADNLTRAQKQAFDNAIKQIAADTKSLVARRPQDFEAVAAEGQSGQDAVVDLIKSTYEQENRLMSIEEAANEVETYLVERALRYAGLNKVKAKTAAVETPANTGVKVEKTPTSTQTLTRSMSQASKSQLSRRERSLAAWNNSGKTNP